MSVFAFRLVATPHPTVKRFASKREAVNNANNWYIPASAQELAEQTSLAPTGALIALFNELSDVKVTKFETRLKGATRLWKLIDDKVKETTEMPTTKNDKIGAAVKAANGKAAAKKTEIAAAKKAASANKTGRKGRSSALTGMLINAKKTVDGTYLNPRRKSAGFGYAAMELVIKAGDKGITTENYLAGGGRLRDLKWDLAHGDVTLTPVATA